MTIRRINQVHERRSTYKNHTLDPKNAAQALDEVRRNWPIKQTGRLVTQDVSIAIIAKDAGEFAAGRAIIGSSTGYVVRGA